MYRGFTHSFKKVTSRHSFTLFGPFFERNHSFGVKMVSENVWKAFKSKKIYCLGKIDRGTVDLVNSFILLFHWKKNITPERGSNDGIFWLLCNNNFQKRLIKKISAEFALFTLSFIRNFQNKNHFMGVLHNLLRGFNSAGSNKQENNTLRQKP